MPDKMQVRDPFLSIWQSAVDEVAAKRTASTNVLSVGSSPRRIKRPDMSNPMMRAATQIALAADKQSQQAKTPGVQNVPASPTGVNVQTLGVQEVINHCGGLASNELKSIADLFTSGDNKKITDYWNALHAKMSSCDPGWTEALAKYFEYYKLSHGSIPYRNYRALDWFIYDRLPQDRDTARIAIIGDWGTGQPEAQNILKQIAKKSPGCVIHLGDVYYSGTDFEMQNYFFNYWSDILDLHNFPQRSTFSLAGNHDMYSGGAPYYRMIDQLGQGASYFCLRNKNWQFLGMDTGYHDHDLTGNMPPTYLQDSEIAWLEHKVQNAQGRKTVLLSHHQLFSAFEGFEGGPVNKHLADNLKNVLPSTTMWLWGHEHNQCIFEKYQGVYGRCIGHGAVPVGSDENQKVSFTDVPLKKVTLGTTGLFYNHGYVIIDLNGQEALISYYQDTDENKPMFQEKIAADGSVSDVK
ncbi:MAG TPA: metallophosphoesterase [Terriglobales bacterium]